MLAAVRAAVESAKHGARVRWIQPDGVRLPEWAERELRDAGVEITTLSAMKVSATCAS